MKIDQTISSTIYRLTSLRKSIINIQSKWFVGAIVTLLGLTTTDKEAHMIMFTSRMPANSSPEDLMLALEATILTADKMEKDLTGGKDTF
jgi:hypothetical protein